MFLHLESDNALIVCRWITDDVRKIPIQGDQ